MKENRGKFNNIDKCEVFSGASAEDILLWGVNSFGKDIVFATSMGAEDQVILDMISRLKLNVDIFTLDTGRLFNETYELIAKSEEHYGIKIKLYSPDASELEDMVAADGVNLFRKSTEMRKLCCRIRKLSPLKRALKGYRSWICGLRSEQSPTRADFLSMEWDDTHSMSKISPIINWSEKDVWDYIREHNVPYNPLHDKGFLSIGCACCTRAVKDGEDVRAGRWWWEKPEHKECGLHNKV